MNADARDVRNELAGLLPAPAERDLPGDRHRLIQEFVMTQVHPHRSPAEQVPRHRPRRRLILASALTAAAAATAAVVVIGAAGPEAAAPIAGGRSAPVATGPAGHQILLAAATTAGRTPAGSGAYWYLRTEAPDWRSESWTRRDGRTWVRGGKTGGKVLELAGPVPFRLGGPQVSFDELQRLPTEPAALKERIGELVRDSDIRTSAGRPDAAMREQMVFDGLLSLIAQLPAPPKVRAAAFQAFGGYPEVTSTGATEGGEGLLIRLDKDWAARLVVDPATARIRRTNFFVTADGARISAPEGRMFTLTTEWTDRPPA